MPIICNLPRNTKNPKNIKTEDLYELGFSNIEEFINLIAEKVANRLLTKQDVVDHLLSEATDLPLSGNMGRTLSEKDKEMWCALIDTLSDTNVSLDCNDYTAPGVSRILMNPIQTASIVNAPEFIDDAFYLMNICFGNIEGTSSLTQLAIPYLNTKCGIGIRRRYAAKEYEWSEWEQLLTKSSQKLKVIGSVAGLGNVHINPKLYTAFLVLQRYRNVSIAHIIPSNIFDGVDSFIDVSGGYRSNANFYGTTYLNVNTKVIENTEFYNNDIDVLNNVTMIVYGMI